MTLAELELFVNKFKFGRMNDRPRGTGCNYISAIGIELIIMRGVG